MEQNFEINGKLVIELINYLAEKKFKETYPLIMALQQLKKVEVKESK